jgi:hypothetical protein
MDGYDPFSLVAFRDYMHELDIGTFALDAPTSDVLVATGREPESFETIARRYAALPQMQRTFSNVARAIADFMTVPFRPGVDRERYAAQLSLPVLHAPLYDLQSERWNFEHARHDAPPGIAGDVVRVMPASPRESVSCS